MAYRKENIIFGAAAVFYSNVSSVDPGWTTAGTSSITPPVTEVGKSFATTLQASAAWHHAGFTSEGVEVEYGPEYKDVEVDQLLDAALIYKTKQTVTVKTTLMEATLEHLVFVWGMQPTVLNGTVGEQDLFISEGALGEQPVERSMAFVGPGPNTVANERTERVYHLRRVLQTEATSHGLKRAEETMFPVSFRCLPDPSATFTGRGYGTVKERRVTGTTTASTFK